MSDAVTTRMKLHSPFNETHAPGLADPRSEIEGGPDPDCGPAQRGGGGGGQGRLGRFPTLF